MKKIKYTIGALMLILFLGCEKSPLDVVDSVDSYIELSESFNIFEQTMMIDIVDAALPETFPENVTVTITGADADYVFESGGSRDFEVVEGKLYLIVNPSYAPEEGADLEFSVNIEAPGYLPVNMEAYFSAEEEDQFVTIPMVKLDAPPAGVGNSSATFSMTGNALSGNQEVIVLPEGDKETGATVSLPDGVMFYDEDGNTLSGGSVNVSLTHFDSEQESSTNAFPGGFMPRSVIGPDGTEEEIVFNTAGFASINMNVGGGKVKSFSEPVTVSMSLSSEVYNTDTEANLAAGDVVPIWSYEVETGQWVYEQDATVVDSEGELSLSFDITHLSWYNIDFYGYRCSWWNANGGVKVLDASGSSTFSGNYRRTYCELVFAWNNRPVSYYACKTYYLYPGQNIHFYNAPRYPCKFRVYSGTSRYDKGTLLTESEVFYPCDNNINLTMPSGFFPEPITFRGTATCANGTVQRPSFYVLYRPVGSYYYRYLTYVRAGEAATTRLQVGQTYEFTTYFNRRRYYTTYTITQTDNVLNFELDSGTCNLIFR
ncbi:hypothetical protein SAMN05216480_10890 [Pustulibacterium marinum]|uniref:Uncharacterized protein n=1 Tax=Pustulibacterium marinum TaxID=1224947 RepID=A0A1I7HBP3_9FLAO|nr:hypothetical protein [Pustulibacterium marinum]SFU58117.1 hypothetical protein SAMN05216480_10890 [Pustulibacterium marinum]